MQQTKPRRLTSARPRTPSASQTVGALREMLARYPDGMRVLVPAGLKGLTAVAGLAAMPYAYVPVATRHASGPWVGADGVVPIPVNATRELCLVLTEVAAPGRRDVRRLRPAPQQ